MARRRRSIHFVPGGSEKMLAKALTLPADGLILDLEDAVPPELKPVTRPIVRRWLETLDFGGRERWVRMNPIFTEHAVPDLEETIAARPDG
ncbi:MAG: aldolase/citrate lyase family protein, partial [Candidatus Rokuibacteriota bacterium]